MGTVSVGKREDAAPDKGVAHMLQQNKILHVTKGAWTRNTVRYLLGSTRRKLITRNFMGAKYSAQGFQTLGKKLRSFRRTKGTTTSELGAALGYYARSRTGAWPIQRPTNRAKAARLGVRLLRNPEGSQTIWCYTTRTGD